MPEKFQPLPDDEPQIELKQFLHRLATEPAFVEKMRAHYEAALALPAGPETAELQAAARKALLTLKHHQGVALARGKLTEAMEVLQAAIQPRKQVDFARLEALLEAAMDGLLDVQEPERTSLINKAMALRAMVRELPGRAE